MQEGCSGRGTVGGEGQPVRIEMIGSKMASLHFFFCFSDLSDFCPRHSFALFLNGIQVALIYNLQSHWVNSFVSAQPAGHSLEQNQGFCREGLGRPMPGNRAATHSCWGRAEGCQSQQSCGDVRDLLGTGRLCTLQLLGWRNQRLSSYSCRAMWTGQLVPVLLGGAQVITVSSAYPGLG